MPKLAHEGPVRAVPGTRKVEDTNKQPRSPTLMAQRGCSCFLYYFTSTYDLGLHVASITSMPK